MTRRAFIAGLGSAVAAATCCRVTWAQANERVRQVGVLMATAPDDAGAAADLAALRQGLAEAGWTEAHNMQLNIRFSGTDAARAEAFARELVALKPDVLLARSTPITAALKEQTSLIPIVFVAISEPIESGLVQTLARPGGNITGFTNFDSTIGGKWLQLLKEADPRITRSAVMYHPATTPFASAFVRSVQAAALALGVEIAELQVRDEAEIDSALAAFARGSRGGLITIPDSFISERRAAVIAATARHRLPAVYATTPYTASGGLMVYAVDTRDMMRRAANYVDRILKGANPGDLPVQQPVKFEFSINLKTAKALGLEIPPTLIARADEVIE